MVGQAVEAGIAALTYVVLVSTFFGYGTWYRLMSRYPASTVVLVGLGLALGLADALSAQTRTGVRRALGTETLNR